MSVSIEDVRLNCPELSETEIDDSWQIEDKHIQDALDDALVITDGIAGMSTAVKDLLVKYLARHLAVLNLRDVTSVKLPNLTASYRVIEAGLGLDQTPYGQQFKNIVSKYTDDFSSSEELNKTPQHVLYLFS